MSNTETPLSETRDQAGNGIVQGFDFMSPYPEDMQQTGKFAPSVLKIYFFKSKEKSEVT